MKKLESTLLNMVMVLTAVTVIAGGLLAYVNQATTPAIERINKQKLNDGIKKVILGAQGGDLKVLATDTKTVPGFTLYLTDKGTAVESVAGGFGGTLKVLVGFDDEGTILGYEILETAETPGLGAKADTWFQKGGKGCIVGLNADKSNLTVSKDGGDVDAITASTITSRAFLLAVTKAYDAFKQSREGEAPSAAPDTKSGASQQKPAEADAERSKEKPAGAEQPAEKPVKSADTQSGASQQRPNN